MTSIAGVSELLVLKEEPQKLAAVRISKAMIKHPKVVIKTAGEELLEKVKLNNKEFDA